MLFFYLLFLQCIASLAASAPVTHHRHRLQSSLFPYGKLADRILNVNDASYIIEDLDDEDMLHVYPENQSVPFSSALPIAASFQPVPVPPSNTIPNVSAENLFSFAFHITDIVRKVVIKEWDTALVRLRKMAMAREQW